MAKWHFDILAFGILAKWQNGEMVERHFGILAFGILAKWHGGKMAFWHFSILAFWHFGIWHFASTGTDKKCPHCSPMGHCSSKCTTSPGPTPEQKGGTQGCWDHTQLVGNARPQSSRTRRVGGRREQACSAAAAWLTHLCWPLAPQLCARGLSKHVVVCQHHHAVGVCNVCWPAWLQRRVCSCVALFCARRLQGQD